MRGRLAHTSVSATTDESLQDIANADIIWIILVAKFTHLMMVCLKRIGYFSLVAQYGGFFVEHQLFPETDELLMNV